MNDAAPPKPPDTLLTLLLPADLETPVIDRLVENPDWATGFTCSTADGHGSAMQPRDPTELVRGRSRRCQIRIALSSGEADALIAHLRGVFANPDIVYWTISLDSFGRLS